MIKKQMIVWVFVLAVIIFSFGTPREIEAQDSYMFLSKKGARWEFDVTLTSEHVHSQQKSILTIVNEGTRAGTNSTVYSWTFRNALGVITRMELFYERSPEGVLLSKMNTYKGSSFISSERYEPPLLALRMPLKIGGWENRSFKISDKGRERYDVVNVVRKVNITVPAGTFDAFEIQGQESTGSTSKEYWVENIGLVGLKQTHHSGAIIAAQLVRYSHAPYEMLTVGEKVFSHRQSWGCASPEFLVEAYSWDAYGHQDQRAVNELRNLMQQKKCTPIYELQGYIVARRGDAVQINGRYPPDRMAVIWVPIWSVAVCHPLLCEPLY